MGRRAFTVLALALVLAACRGGVGDTSSTTLPPTTRVPTPADPTGLVDTVRRWVTLLEKGDDGAFAMLGPGTQKVIGGREGYRSVRADLRRTWGRWAEDGTEPGGTVFDGFPVSDGLAVVVVSADDGNGTPIADAVPMRVHGDRWLAEPLLDTGPFRAVPEPSAVVGVLPELAVEVDEGVTVTAFVDGQPARIGRPATAAGGRVVIAYRASVGLGPGPHLVALVLRRGDAVTARALHYEVAPDG